MNKIVCNICGTSYPENAAQCPICGYVHSVEADAVNTSYTYVKGGRYSKANVRKRNQEVQHVVDSPSSMASEKEHTSKNTGRAGAVILIVILLLAIIAVIGYIVLRFFVPNDFLYEGLNNHTVPTTTQAATEAPTEQATEVPTIKEIACTDITASEREIIFDAIGNSTKLTIAIAPANTTDTLVYTTSDPTVISVDNRGNVTAVGEGSAVITVFCGNVSIDIPASCTVPKETEPVSTVALMLNRKEITFDAEGQSWMLYDGGIAVSEITWSSDDNTVATIIDGKVVAVGNGDTTVYATYEGQTVNCTIHCDFTGEGTGSNGGVSEAGGDSQRVCKLYNPYGNSDDVTMQVGEQFSLSLVDDEKNAISDATWSINDDSICSYENGIVTALASGTTEIIASYEGNSYTCIVRVK